jgi:hypothetical protein
MVYVLRSAINVRQLTRTGASMSKIPSLPQNDADNDRRKFLATCGKFAVVTPPAITMLLSTSLTSDAIAQSGGRGVAGAHRDNGYGTGGNDGSPNGKFDTDKR